MTEIGWPDSQYPSQRDEARFALFAMFDAIKLGVVRSYYYALYNDGSGKFGLMNTDGTPKQSGAALHNVMAILADTAAGTPWHAGFHHYRHGRQRPLPAHRRRARASTSLSCGTSATWGIASP
jgi:hypothetical protein